MRPRRCPPSRVAPLAPRAALSSESMRANIPCCQSPSASIRHVSSSLPGHVARITGYSHRLEPNWSTKDGGESSTAQPFDDPLRRPKPRGTVRFFWGSPPDFCFVRPCPDASFRSPSLPFALLLLAMILSSLPAFCAITMPTCFLICSNSIASQYTPVRIKM